MTSDSLKQELHHFIDNCDEELLKRILAVIKEYNDEQDELEFSEEEIKELDALWAKYLSGESKGYTWEEAKKIILRQA